MFSKKSLLACWKINLAQLLLLWIIFPLIMLVCYIIKPGSQGSATQDIFINMFSFIPIVEVAVDILSQFTSGITSSEFVDITFTLILRKFPEAVLLTMIVHFCNEIFAFIHGEKEPLPIISTLAGVCITAALVKAFGLIANNLIAFLTEIGVIIIMIIGMKIMFKSFFGGKIFSLMKILLLVVDGLLAIILVTYFASCYMAGTGKFSSALELFGFLFIQTLVACGASVLAMMVRYLGQDIA